MLTNQLAVRYAQALYEMAAEKDMLDKTGEQLQMVEATINGSEDLAMLINHPLVPAVAKKDTINQIFGQDLVDFVHKFLLLLVDKKRETLFPAIVREYVGLANAARNIIEAEVITATPLSDNQRLALVAKLNKVTGKKTVLHPQVDQRIMGGVIVKIGDKLIDGSVARQLRMLQTALLKSEVTKIGVTN
mgnify:CR=1 FL=1